MTMIIPAMKPLKADNKVKVEVYSHREAAAKSVASTIADLIYERQQIGRMAVLGLATGATPAGVYRELIRLHQDEGLSFKHVVTFNLDEYYPIEPDAEQSFSSYMRRNLFDWIDISPHNIHIPDGEAAEDEITAACQAYEQKIEGYGGLDLQLLGIGRNGHIGFNEPGAASDSTTRLVTLEKLTRQDAAKYFEPEMEVPQKAVTMGIKTILKAKKIILMAWGKGKASIVQEAILSDRESEIPAVCLQRAEDITYVLDLPAASSLTFNYENENDL